MTLASSFEKKRVVVPRWRSLASTPNVETVPTPNFPEVQPLTIEQFKDFIKVWRASGKPEDIVDILDAGIVAGNRTLVKDAAAAILRNKDDYAPLVVNRAHNVIFGKPSIVISIPKNADVSGDSIQKIAQLKKVLIESPRNSLAHVEIARLYARMGQMTKSEKHLYAAWQVNKNDRFTLRAMTRFLTLLHEPGEALRILRIAPATNSDPWLQSAELASGMLLGAGLRRFAFRGRQIEARKAIPIEFSELATGWATQLEIAGASRKKVFSTLLPSLAEPTENALAQGVWLTDHLGEEFSTRFSNVDLPADAHEARALALIEQEQFNLATTETELWVADQPFQLRSFVVLCHLRFAHLGDFEGALSAATEGLMLHGENWTLLNYAAISSAAAGKTEKASAFLKRFAREASDDRKNAFYLGAEGMLFFSLRRFPEAVDKYIETLRFCVRKKLLSLVPSVLMFFVDNLSRYEMLTRDDCDAMVALISEQIRRLSKQDAREATRTFASLSSRWFSALQVQLKPLDPSSAVQKILSAARELETSE